MKNFVLIHVEETRGTGFEAGQGQIAFVNKTEQIPLKDEASRKLGSNAWLLERENDLEALSSVVAAAKGFRLKTKVHWFSE